MALSWTVIIGILIFFVGIGLFFLPRKRKGNYPSGPCSLPIFGDLLWLGKEEPYKTFLKWSKKYGPIFSCRLGSYPCIVINDAKMIKEALTHPLFAGRPHIPLYDQSQGGRGFLSDDPNVMTQRNFMVKNIRKFVYSDENKMVSKLQEEVQDVIDRLKENSGKSIGISHMFQRPVTNTIWNLIMGKRFHIDDPELAVLSNAVAGILTRDDVIKNLSVFIGYLPKYLPEYSRFNSIVRSFSTIQKFMENDFKKPLPDRVPEHPTTFKEAYMDRIDATQDLDSSFHKSNHYYKETSAGLFIGSMETISSSIEYFFAHMLYYPDIAAKIQREIDTVVGYDRLPRLSDRPFMPFTQACIHETLRFTPTVPLSVYRRVVEDGEFHGYFLPKDIIVIGNLWAGHFDEKYWNDPEVYRPERFLDLKTGEIIKHENFLAFGWGRRICPGEALAWDILFVFITSLLQNFNCKLPPGENLPSLIPIPGIAFTPQPYNIIFTSRKL